MLPDWISYHDTKNEIRLHFDQLLIEEHEGRIYFLQVWGNSGCILQQIELDCDRLHYVDGLNMHTLVQTEKAEGTSDAAPESRTIPLSSLSFQLQQSTSSDKSLLEEEVLLDRHIEEGDNLDTPLL